MGEIKKRRDSETERYGEGVGKIDREEWGENVKERQIEPERKKERKEKKETDRQRERQRQTLGQG